MVVPPDHLPQICRFEVSLVSKAVYISISSPPNYCLLVIVVAATIMNWLKSFDLEKFSIVRPTCVYSPATFFLALCGDPRLLIVLVHIVKGILHCKHFQRFLELSGVAELQPYCQCNYFFQVPLGSPFWIPPHSSTRTLTFILLLLTIHTVKCFTVIRLCIEVIYWITSILRFRCLVPRPKPFVCFFSCFAYNIIFFFCKNVLFFAVCDLKVTHLKIFFISLIIMRLPF
jgi:hypothetical protein